MKAYMDEVHFERGGSEVHMRKRSRTVASFCEGQRLEEIELMLTNHYRRDADRTKVDVSKADSFIPGYRS